MICMYNATCTDVLLLGKGEEPELATQVLQFIYVSDNGFRFPIAQFPSGVYAHQVVCTSASGREC